MLLFITTRDHHWTVAPLVGGKLGEGVPTTRAMSYDALFRARRIPSATVIFTDVERLYPWELQLAAELYLSFRAIGLRCLNNPARVPTRYELLRRLHRRGLNPFDIHRAEDDPRPSRFPVFVRNDHDHGQAVSDLIGSQIELEAFLASCIRDGRPLRGMVVIEFCGEPVAEGIWRKFGSFRIGERMHVDHHVTEDRWLVKYGGAGPPPDWLVEDEHRRVVENACPLAVQAAFHEAGIEYGRADHATVEGREVIYEINTNPTIWQPQPQATALRDETLAHSRRTMIRNLAAIDSGDGTPLDYAASERVAKHRETLTDKDWSPRRP